MFCNLARVTFLGLLTTVLLSACSTPEHTNTLIMVTNTKVGVDVSATPAGGSPGVTIGYNRQEVALAPLLANQKDGDAMVPATCPSDGAGCLFQAKDDNNGGKTDAYSVLGSFGADIEGSASGASVGLAQYFATGLAAQKLAEVGGAELVSVNTARSSDAARQAAQRFIEADKSHADTVANYVTSGGTVDVAKLTGVFKCRGYGDTNSGLIAAQYAGLNAAQTKAKLIQDEDWLARLASCTS